jgi:DNA ligase (NAD+)
MQVSKKELKELLEQIDNCDEEYYNNNNKLIQDPEYDILKVQLRTMYINFIQKNKSDKSFAAKIEDALSRVGAPPPKDGKWPKVEHEVSMPSLNKVNIPDEFIKWSSTRCNSEFLITEKLDGISISLKYDNGKFVQGSTRGSGEIGEDISRNVIKMQGVPLELNNNFTGYIRGEIILRHSDWKEHFPEMANPRNASSGIAKRIDGQGVQHLSVIAYTIEGKDFDYEEQAFNYIENLGFDIPNYIIGSSDIVLKQWQEYMNRKREKLNYDIDGLVIRINNRSVQFALGEENHRPNGSVAFKFEAPEAETIIRNIVCQVGDSGQITPVAEFDEVELMGAKIKRASLHNFTIVKELKINIGSRVVVSRRNDVIPYIEKVINGNDKYFNSPCKCPICSVNIIESGEYIKCPNNDCPSKVIGRLNKWISELGILEWGESILVKLIDSGLVKDVDDLYKLSVDDISKLDRMGQKSAENLINELNKFKSIYLENLIGGLCIDGVATSTAKSIISEGYDTLLKIYKLSINELENIPGLGEKKALIFYNGIHKNEERINRILAAGVSLKEKIKGNLSGKSFCFTGKSEIPRAKLQKMVIDTGGEIKKTVSKDLDYLVMESSNSTSSKAEAARKNNITLISEKQFLEMVG